MKPAQYKDKSVYHLDSRGETHKNYDWLYKVRDRYQTYMDKETLLPHWFHRVNYEGGFEVENEYEFFHDKNIAYTKTENSDRPYAEDTIEIKDCTLDLLSLIYFTRNLDLSNLKVNEKVPVNAMIDNELFDLYIRYLGKEEIKDRNDNKHKCLKFSALLVEGTIFKGGEDMFIWVSDDKNRVPVLVEAKILIGSVKAYLTGTKGLRYPTTSIINK